MTIEGNLFVSYYIAGEDIPAGSVVWVQVHHRMRSDEATVTARRLLGGREQVGHVIGVTLRAAKEGDEVAVAGHGFLRHTHDSSFAGEDAWVGSHGFITTWERMSPNEWTRKIGVFMPKGIWLALGMGLRRKLRVKK